MHFNEVNRGELRTITFEYILLKMSRWYSEKTGLITVGDFNKSNDLTSSKILLYPFFISTSNGHSRDLLTLLGDFFPFDEGPTSIEILEIMERGDTVLTFFSTDYLKASIGLKIKNYPDSIDINIALTDIENKILETTVELVTGGSGSFKDIEVKKDIDNSEHSTIDVAVESSIKAMKKYSNENFVLFKPSDLTVLGKFYDSYTNGVRKGDFKAMAIEDILTDRRPY